MSEELNREFEGKTLKAESNPKVLGFIFILLALLVLALGLVVHIMQTGGLPNDTVVNILIVQLHIKFATDFFVGFFSGIFAVLGFYYYRQKPKALEATKGDSSHSEAVELEEKEE
jgi:hypothetical protein